MACAHKDGRPVCPPLTRKTMLQAFRSLLSRRLAEDLPAIPAGQRVYTIGDIHGRLDLFDALAEAIEADDAASSSAETGIILLGDLVDRGPDSAGVLKAARWWQERRNVRILCGNHEEMLVRSMDSIEVLRHFLRHGGKQTMVSFGVDERALAIAEVDELQLLLRESVPPALLDFIATFEDMIRIGDYAFVHAGIDPHRPLDTQTQADLRWIREPFLSHPDPYGAVIVHGHSISEEPEDKGNRIGIDTGAYATGRLTALVLEGASRRYIEAVEADGKITVRHRTCART